jgi:hypothetical protein
MQTLIGFGIAALVAALVRKMRFPGRESFPAILLCPLLALVPAGVFFAVSAATPVHLVIPRYLTVTAPGSALTWALLTSYIDSRVLRQIFCVGLVGITLFEAYSSPLSRQHELNFKQAHAFVNANVAKDEGTVPVLVCSAFIESDHTTELGNSDGENPLYSQVSYYPIHAPLVFLPMDLNDETIRVAGQTVLAAAQKHQRFIFVVPPSSYPTLQWLDNYTQGAFTAQILEEFDEILVVEFRPVAAD